MGNQNQAAGNPPPGWPRIASSLFYEDAGAAIDWLCAAFGFDVVLRVDGEGGRVEHSQLTFGDGLIMVSSVREDSKGRSPKSLDGAYTQALALFVDDVDAHSEAAREAGAVIADAPVTVDYGDDYWSDRTYRAIDPEGHSWWFMQRMHTKGHAS